MQEERPATGVSTGNAIGTSSASTVTVTAASASAKAKAAPMKLRVGESSEQQTISLTAQVAKDQTFLLKVVLPKGVQIVGSGTTDRKDEYQVVFEGDSSDSSWPKELPSQQFQFVGVAPGTHVVKYELADDYSNSYFHLTSDNLTIVVVPKSNPKKHLNSATTAGLAVACIVVLGGIGLISTQKRRSGGIAVSYTHLTLPTKA